MKNIIAFRKRFTAFKENFLIIAIESNGNFNGNHLASEIYTIIESGTLNGLVVKTLCGKIKYYCSKLKNKNNELPKIGFSKTRQLTEDYIWRFESLMRWDRLKISNNFSTINKKGKLFILKEAYIQLSNFEAPNEDIYNPRYKNINKKLKLTGKKKNVSDDTAICWLCVTEILNNIADRIRNSISEDNISDEKTIFEKIKNVHKLPPTSYNYDEDDDI